MERDGGLSVSGKEPLNSPAAIAALGAGGSLNAASGAPAPAAAAAAAAASAREGDAEDEDEEEDAAYTVDHLSAVIRPVALTMILASLAVGQIRQPQQDAAISQGLSSYLVYQESSGSGGGGESGGTLFGQALVNALVIVGVICAATFVLVLCYYFRCLKLMIGYLIFASVNLLGYSGGFMVISAIQLAQLTFDWGTLAFLMYNFAIAGAVAVFWQKGIPRIVTQAYLIAVSVIMSWLVTKLPEWTSWSLLVMLALYDLCAVLTPCGPLRALISLAQTRRDPIPGLLYEANVGGGGSGDGVRDTFASGAAPRPQQVAPPPAGAASASTDKVAVWPAARGSSTQAQQRQQQERHEGAPSPGAEAEVGLSLRRIGGGSESAAQPPATAAAAAAAAAPTSTPSASSGPTMVIMPPPGSRRAAQTPAPPDTPSLLPGAPSAGDAVVRNSMRGGGGGGGGGTVAVKNPLAAANAAAEDYDDDDGAAEAAAVAAAAEEEEAAAAAAAAARGGDGEEDVESGIGPHGESEDRSIKLGLGDFVFYSVLVSRAALFDMSTMAACFVSVLMGLGGTLFLLSLFKKALPALPISIFLGVSAYFMTRLVVTPLIVELSLNALGI